jgi:hypothetical protein
MQNDLFSYTTRQAAQATDTTVEAIRAQYRRNGKWRGITPTVLPNGRLLWPRVEVLALTGVFTVAPKTMVSLLATDSWLETRGILASDPVANQIAFALVDPRDDATNPAQWRVEDAHALCDWSTAHQKRFHAALPRFTPRELAEGYRLLARAIAPIASSLPEGALAQAVHEHLGELS